VSFKNTIIIATSNIGSNVIQEKLSAQSGTITPEQAAVTFSELTSMLTDELHKFFRPELLNRFDEIVIFKPLAKENMMAIAKLGVMKTGKLLKEQGYGLQITDKAVAKLAEDGYDPVYGARPLRRLIQTAIENPIALQIISKAFIAGDTITVDYDDAKQDFSFVKGAAQQGDANGYTGNPDATGNQSAGTNVTTPTASSIGSSTVPTVDPMSPVTPISPAPPVQTPGVTMPDPAISPVAPVNPMTPPTSPATDGVAQNQAAA
jgi:hypothetical protein